MYVCVHVCVVYVFVRMYVCECMYMCVHVSVCVLGDTQILIFISEYSNVRTPTVNYRMLL